MESDFESYLFITNGEENNALPSWENTLMRIAPTLANPYFGHFAEEIENMNLLDIGYGEQKYINLLNKQTNTISFDIRNYLAKNGATVYVPMDNFVYNKIGPDVRLEFVVSIPDKRKSKEISNGIRNEKLEGIIELVEHKNKTYLKNAEDRLVLYPKNKKASPIDLTIITKEELEKDTIPLCESPLYKTTFWKVYPYSLLETSHKDIIESIESPERKSLEEVINYLISGGVSEVYAQTFRQVNRPFYAQPYTLRGYDVIAVVPDEERSVKILNGILNNENLKRFKPKPFPPLQERKNVVLHLYLGEECSIDMDVLKSINVDIMTEKELKRSFGLIPGSGRKVKRSREKEISDRESLERIKRKLEENRIHVYDTYGLNPESDNYHGVGCISYTGAKKLVRAMERAGVIEKRKTSEISK